MAHPHLSQALLSSGTQAQAQIRQPANQLPTQQQQQPVQMQVVVKNEAGQVGNTSSSIIKSLLATKVTISGECVPTTGMSCVSVPSACLTNTSIASSLGTNQILSANQVCVCS